jgi:plastocyanin domain-containing protein
VPVVLLCLGACADGDAFKPKDGRPVIAVNVLESGYEPARASADAGTKVRLVFTRKTDEGCGQQIVIPALGIRRDLPLERPVAVDVTMPDSGVLAFTCGMAMYKGSVVAVEANEAP